MRQRLPLPTILSFILALAGLACDSGGEVCVSTPTVVCPGDEFGSISGSILDSGLPLFGVTATLSGSQTTPVTSDSRGAFAFERIAAGTYTLTVSGYPSACSDPGGSFSRDVTVADLQATDAAFLLSCSTAWSTISAGRQSCGTRTSGAAYCWGRGEFGALGDGANTNTNTPVAVASTLSMTQVAIHFNHGCGLASGGVAYCWGQNTNGELGTGDTNDTNTPTLVNGGLTFNSLGESGCAIDAGGTGYCWGGNDRGQLGDGTNNSSTAPVAVTGGLQFSAIGGGESHTCGLTTGGDVYCWGENLRGQLGQGATGAPVNTPQLVVGGRSYSDLAVGREFNCAVSTGGELWCWGRNIDKQTGQPDGSTKPTPVRVGSGTNWTDVTAGARHTCALQGSQAFCWGRGGGGQLGNGGLDTTPTPSAVSGGLAFDRIDGGVDHTCGLAGGVAYCWGSNVDGEVGDGTETLRSVPTQVLLSS